MDDNNNNDNDNNCCYIRNRKEEGTERNVCEKQHNLEYRERKKNSICVVEMDVD